MPQSLGSSKEKVIESFDKVTVENDLIKRKFRMLVNRFSDNMAAIVSQKATKSKSGLKIYGIYDDEIGDDYYIALGEKSIDIDPFLVYVALIQDQERIKVIVFVGEESRNHQSIKNCEGNFIETRRYWRRRHDKFAQGGGRDKSKIHDCLKNLENLLTDILDSSEKMVENSVEKTPNVELNWARIEKNGERGGTEDKIFETEPESHKKVFSNCGISLPKFSTARWTWTNIYFG